ncbi:hypothetical protein GOP47_0028861 [Adiantum capillus-veneris]|nr:hypothetical protein GOP47_0028861 [Adiantum capillus-veneris]
MPKRHLNPWCTHPPLIETAGFSRPNHPGNSAHDVVILSCANCPCSNSHLTHVCTRPVDAQPSHTQSCDAPTACKPAETLVLYHCCTCPRQRDDHSHHAVITINENYPSSNPSLTPTYTYSADAHILPLHQQTAYGHARYEDASTTCINVDGHNLQSRDTYKQPHNSMCNPCHALLSPSPTIPGKQLPPGCGLPYNVTHCFPCSPPNLVAMPHTPGDFAHSATVPTVVYPAHHNPLHDRFTSPPRALMEGLLDSDEPWSLVGVEVPHFEDDAAYCVDNAEDTSTCSHLPLVSHNTPSSLNIPHIHFITPPISDVSHTFMMSPHSDYVCVFTISLTHIITHNEQNLASFHITFVVATHTELTHQSKHIHLS